MNKPNFKPTNQTQNDYTFCETTEEQKQKHLKDFCLHCTNYYYCKQKQLCAYFYANEQILVHNAICYGEKAFEQAFFYVIHALILDDLSVSYALFDAFSNYLNPLHKVFGQAKKECEVKHDLYSWQVASTFFTVLLKKANCLKFYKENYGVELLSEVEE